MCTFCNNSNTNYCMLRSIFFCTYYLFLYIRVYLSKTWTNSPTKTNNCHWNSKGTPEEKKPPLQAVFFTLCLKNVNGCFLLPPLLFFRGGRGLRSIALVSHREGIPEVSVGPLICVLHCPNSLCLLFSLYLSPSVSPDPFSQQAGLA